MNGKTVFALMSIAIIAVIVIGYVSTPADENNDPEYGTIGIIGAMDVEVETLIQATDISEIRTVTGMDYYVGSMNGKNVVIVKCGMGKVNAGICTQMLITEFNVDCVINTGVAGSLDNRLNIEDMVISKDVVQHDFDVSPIGYQKGEIPYTGLYAFEANDHLIAMASKAIEECAPEINYLEGRVCTGDQFIATAEQKEKIVSTFGGLCCEMEGGAIGQVCYLNDTPFVILRAVSDKADGSDTEDYSEFERKAAIRCASIVQYMVSNMDW